MKSFFESLNWHMQAFRRSFLRKNFCSQEPNGALGGVLLISININVCELLRFLPQMEVIGLSLQALQFYNTLSHLSTKMPHPKMRLDRAQARLFFGRGRWFRRCRQSFYVGPQLVHLSLSHVLQRHRLVSASIVCVNVGLSDRLCLKRPTPIIKRTRALMEVHYNYTLLLQKCQYFYNKLPVKQKHNHTYKKSLILR